jgi:hypothetical protein
MLEILASVQTCRDKAFSTLEELVYFHVAEVSGCICVFIEWDKARQDFVASLRARSIPLRVFVVTETEETLHPGPLAGEPENFCVLPVGKVGEKLAML